MDEIQYCHKYEDKACIYHNVPYALYFGIQQIGQLLLLVVRYIRAFRDSLCFIYLIVVQISKGIGVGVAPILYSMLFHSRFVHYDTYLLTPSGCSNSLFYLSIWLWTSWGMVSPLPINVYVAKLSFRQIVAIICVSKQLEGQWHIPSVIFVKLRARLAVQRDCVVSSEDLY